MGAPVIVVYQFDVPITREAIRSILEIGNREWNRHILSDGYEYTVLISDRFIDSRTASMNEVRGHEQASQPTVTDWVVALTPQCWGAICEDPLGYGRIPESSASVLHYPWGVETAPCVGIGWIEVFMFPERTHLKLKMRGEPEDLDYILLQDVGECLVQEFAGYGIECAYSGSRNLLESANESRVVIEHYEQHIGAQTNIEKVAGPVTSGQLRVTDTVFDLGLVNQRQPVSNAKGPTAMDLQRRHGMKSEFDQGYALVVGVGADLPNTVDDALGLAGILKDEERCAYPSAQVQVLTVIEATPNAVLAALDQLAQSADEAATVVIYFSGHGYRVSTSMDDVYYLMPYGYDVNKLKTTAIRGSEFAGKLRAIRAKKLLVLLDCCHAGGVGDAKSPHIEEMTKAPLPPEAVQLLSEGKGRVLIASSQEDELSYAGKPYSAFTLALIEALSGVGVAKKDGYTRVADLALHAREVVPGRTKDRQHPILHFEQADNFVLAYYAGGDTEPKGLPFNVEPEIEPEPGAWQGVKVGSGALAQGDHAVAVGERGAYVGGNVGGDVVTGEKRTVFNQTGQTVHGAQTNINGDVQGPVFSGRFDGPVAVGGGEAVDLRGSQGAVYKPTGPVRQHYGDSIRITGDGNVIGNNSQSTVIKNQTTGVSMEAFQRLLTDLSAAIAQAKLDPDVSEMAEQDLRMVQTQADKPKPNAGIIVAKLGSVLSMLATADGVWGLTERLRPMTEQALQMAKVLFK